MAGKLQLLLGGGFYFSSVALWGARGCTLLFMQFLSSPKTFFQLKDHSAVPKKAKDPSLGVHDKIVLPSQNLRIKYVANGERGKPLMLCVHGFPECWYSWRHQLKEFADDYWVVAIDLPGYGGSDKPKGKEPYKADNLVNNLAELVRELGYEKATMVSHDWGGALVWRFAVVHADMCEKVVVMNAPNAVGFKKGFSFKQYCQSWYMFFFQLPWLPEMMCGANDLKFLDMCFTGRDSGFVDIGLRNKQNMDSDDVAVFKHSFHTWESRECAVNFYRANNMLSGLLNPPPKTKKVLTAPTLLIWGTEDTALTLELARHSATMSDLITVEYVENSSHWVQQDRPEEVNRLMRNFLQQKSKL